MNIRPKIDKYRRDMDYRAEVGLYVSFILNLGFVAFKLGSGIWLRSWWLAAVGVYYFMIGGIRFFLLRDVRRTPKLEERSRLAREYRAYRRTGWLLLILDTAIFGMAVQMVAQDKSTVYPGVFIYGSAAYTFYFFGIAIANVIRFHKRSGPLLSAAKNISFVSALMSMFVLQTAMLATFDEGGSSFRRIINRISGAVVFAFVTYTAIRMIVHGTKKLKELEYR